MNSSNHNAGAPLAARVQELESVLRAVSEQIEAHGSQMRFPDGFDGRVFTWMRDALAAAPAQQAGAPLPLAPSDEQIDSAWSRELRMGGHMTYTGARRFARDVLALATPPQALADRAIVATYENLHAGKLGAHWLWCVIEQIAAGVPEVEAMRGYGYYEPRDPATPQQATLRAKANPEKPSTALLRVTAAGQALSNCAFNLSQHAGEAITDRAAETMRLCQIEWDAACTAFREATRAQPQADAAEPVAAEDARDVIGKALSDYMTKNSEAGVFSTDPFDSREIDALAGAVLAAQAPGARGQA